MFNPYTSRGEQPVKKSITVGSELKRLFGGFRFPLSFFFVLGPLILALCGGLDLLVNWLYSISHRGSIDPRPAIFWAECLNDQSKKLCKGLYFGSVAGTQKIRLWPFLHPLEPPYLYLGLVIFAWLAFLSIGNPRLKPLGKFLRQIFFLSFAKRGDDSSKRNKLIPWKSNGDPDEKSWVIGGLVQRLWDSDPGYFSFVSQTLDRSRGETNPEPFLLSSRILQTNLIIVAPPGQGKTGSVFHPLTVFSRRVKGAAIFFDSKGNDFNPDYFDYNLDLNDPANSIKINLFSGATPAQAGERLAEALIPDLSEDKQYFTNIAKDAMATLVAAHHVCFKKLPELNQLQNYLTYSTKLQRLLDRLVENLNGNWNTDGLHLTAGIRRLMMLMENKNDLLGSLTTALSPLLTEPVSSLLVANPGSNSYTIEELLKKPNLIRFGLSVADNPRIAPMLGRLILAQFTFAVLSPSCNTKIFKLAAVDEAHNFVTPSIAKGMAHARSNNAGYALAVQTLSQIEEKGRPLLNTIFAASGTKIVMAGVGDEDAERFSRTFGEVELPYVTHSHSSSRTSGHTSTASRNRGHEIEFFPGGGGSEHRASPNRGRTSIANQLRGEGSNEQLRLRRLFLPSEIRSLPLRHAIIESSDASGQRWPAQVINMDRTLVNELEKKLTGKKSRKRNLSEDKALTPVDNEVVSKPLVVSRNDFTRPTFKKINFGNQNTQVSTTTAEATQSSLELTPKTEKVVQVENGVVPVKEMATKTSETKSEREANKHSEVNSAKDPTLEKAGNAEPAGKEQEEKDPLEEIMFGKFEGEV